ncbi:MAG: HutP family protein [Phascolarctobacterium sp.]|nr:HutP family protein [Phascolarctobacterium sp.]MBQ7759633.1 HutP family protein [Acidaminococcaceae bacterium]
MLEKSPFSSIDIGRAALRLALTATRAEEQQVKELLSHQGIRAAAVDFGGDFIPSVVKIMERAVVAAQRQGLVSETHVGAGAVAGATHAALEQVKSKAVGFNVGGKIGVARCGEHVCVAIFMGVGVLNLNEMCVGLAHRSVPKGE